MQFSNCGKTELYRRLLLDQTGHHGRCPQADIKTILARIIAVDPGKYLFPLARGKRARTPGCRTRTHGTQSLPWTRHDSEPLVNRGSIESIRRDDRRSAFAFSNPSYRRNTHRFKRSMIETAPISPHNPWYDFAASLAMTMSPYFTTGE
jgi:hypothetical protein